MESREDRLERALRGLVEELHEYDYVAQVDTDDLYGPDTALGWAEAVLSEPACPLKDILRDLIAWDDHMGGWEAECWQRAREVDL